MWTVPDKKEFIIFILLCFVAYGLGYWYGMPEEDSDERAEVSAPPTPTVVTNVVTNVLNEVVTNIVAATPQPTPTPAPVKPQPIPAPVKPRPQPTPTKIVPANHIVYEGKVGPGKGKHLVFLTGDEEYRGEEGLPMMAKILSQHHGFKCTVLFSLNDKGEIDPNNQKSLTHPEALDTADAIIMLLRFRTWPDEVYKHFDAACNRGVPIIGLRTSIHAFRGKIGGFGKRVLGEGWVSPWGGHKREATRGAIEPSEKNNPIFNGVTDVFGDADVYEAYPAKDSKILLRGLVLENMKPDSKPSIRERKKGRGVNDPAMAVAWTRNYKWPSGKTSKIFCSTMGAATDLQSEGLRRLFVNAVYAGLEMAVPKKANVDYVDPYKPLFYGFNSFRRGIKPSDHALGKVLPAGQKKK